DRPGERLGELGLAHAGHVLNQQVPLGEEHGKSEPDRGRLSLDDLLDVLDDGPGAGGELVRQHWPTEVVPGPLGCRHRLLLRRRHLPPSVLRSTEARLGSPANRRPTPEDRLTVPDVVADSALWR